MRGDRAARWLEDDLVDVTRLVREAFGEERLGVCGVGARQTEGVRVGRSNGLREDVNEDEEREPGEKDVPTMANTEMSKRFQRGILLGEAGAVCYFKYVKRTISVEEER